MTLQEIWQRIKFFFLILLILLSIIQTGVLWYKQNQGLPFSFLNIKNTANDNLENDPAMKQKYIQPEQIVISTGYGEIKHLLPVNNEDYGKIWTEVKQKYLSVVFEKNLKPTKVDEVFSQGSYDYEWGRLMSRYPYCVKLEGKIPTTLIAWSLGKSEDNLVNLPPNIYEIIVAPDDDETSGRDTLYLTDGIKIYQFILGNVNSEIITVSSALKLSEKLDADNKPAYISTFEQLGNLNPSIGKDIVVQYNFQRKFLMFPIIRSIPNIGLADSYNITQLDNITSILLGKEESDTYIPSTDKNGTAIFKKPGKLYTVYKTGILEYKNISPVEKKSEPIVSDAFIQAITYIDEINQKANLVSGVNINLSKVYETENQEFEFYFTYNMNTNDGAGAYKVYSNGEKNGAALYIKADANNVIECRWVMGNFDVNASGTTYLVDFKKLLDTTSELFDRTGGRDLKLKDASIGYKFNPEDRTEYLIEPIWGVDVSGDSKFYFNLSKAN